MNPESACLQPVYSVNDGNTWGNGNILWLLLIFALCGGNGLYGGGMRGNSPALTQVEMQQGFDTQSVLRKLDGLQSGLCDGFYAQNTTMLNGFNGLQRDMHDGFSAVSAGLAENRFTAQQCCCDINRNIDAVRAENYKNTCEIVNAIHADGEATRAMQYQSQMQNLRDRLEERDRMLQTANFQLSQQAQSANIISTLRPFPQPAYITCSPYQAATNACYQGCNNCGC